MFQFSGTNLENLGAFVNTCLVLARIKGMEADSDKMTGMAGWSSQNNEKGVDNIVQYNIGYIHLAEEDHYLLERDKEELLRVSVRTDRMSIIQGRVVVT